MEVYIDDILVNSTKANTHPTDLNKIFAVVWSYRLKLNPTKCAFSMQSEKFLGYMVTPKEIKVNHAKIKVLQEIIALKQVHLQIYWHELAVF